MLQNILVVGGNGFIGSAICKAAVARGMNVTSMSKTGSPFRTPKGHAPAWTSKVEWVAADALDQSSYENLIPERTAIVHTLGTLLEGTDYKTSVRNGNPLGLAKAIFQNFSGSENPLEEKADRANSYERLNRDSALRVCEAFVSKSTKSKTTGDQLLHRKPFIYISAEDIFRPIIPTRYIETKRSAERGIYELLQVRSDLRAAFIRPSLVYHPHFRPLSTPVAAVLDLFSTLHRNTPTSIPTPASILRSLSPSDSSSSFNSIAHALTIPPIHVDHVAEAVCKVIEDDTVEGVVDVQRMRELIGWTEKANTHRLDAV